MARTPAPRGTLPARPALPDAATLRSALDDLRDARKVGALTPDVVLAVEILTRVTVGLVDMQLLARTMCDVAERGGATVLAIPTVRAMLDPGQG